MVSRVLATLILLSLVLGCTLLFVYREQISDFRQQVNDHFAARNFEASSEIVDLTEELLLTKAGHRIFWASEPTLDASQNFNEQCSMVDHSEEGHVLGCFANDRIHLFKVTDERLQGIVEVTAAHELLHAVWARMTPASREDLVQRLNQYYEEASQSDPDLVSRMAVYEHLSETSFANELHSVLGTEKRELPVWLERHYGKWFKDRARVLDFFDSYHSVFDELQQRASELQEQLAALREDIESRSATYTEAVERFNADWDSFVARNNAFEFSDDPDEFYRLREAFYERRDALDAERRSLSDDIDRYEELRGELSALSSLNHELEQQLDSALAPPAPAPID